MGSGLDNFPFAYQNKVSGSGTMYCIKYTLYCVKSIEFARKCMISLDEKTGPNVQNIIYVYKVNSYYIIKCNF